MPHKSLSRTRIVKPENMLKNKVGQGGITPATVASAQSRIENNNIDFRPIAQELNRELANIVALVRRQAHALENTNVLDLLAYPAMQLKAQGALFHYPSVSALSNIVVDLLENASALDDVILEILDSYLRSIDVLVTLQIKSPDADESRNLCVALHDACVRYFKHKDIKT